MLIHSFVQSDFGIRSVRVEVVLVPGVSQIQILGLPDQLIKESSKRIIAALRHQGFRIPPGQQALVNLHPNHFKKTSQGLDLAIALGILIESKQVDPVFFDFSKNYCYGSLTLKGEVQVPDDLKLLNYEKFNKVVLTGHNDQIWRFDSCQLKELSHFFDLDFKKGDEKPFICQPTVVDESFYFEQKLARLMSIVAIGEHPLLIAGFAGCGKTTLVEHLATLLSQPEQQCFLDAKKYWMLTGRELTTRPIVQPHHSATPISMIGGGANIKFGEISLAHGGALILDELLEFHPSIQSALREPMEKGRIYLSRAGGRQVFLADSLVLATTNLCPCGNFQPGATYRCRCSSLKLRNYVERLTGPFLDRFSIFYLYEKPKIDLKVKLTDIKISVDKGIGFQQNKRNQKIKNNKLSLTDLKKQLDPVIAETMIPHTKSKRRRLSLLRVARTLADMDNCQSIKQEHLEEASLWTASDIYKLERFRMEDFAAR